MNALLNAHTKRGCDSPPHIGFASNVSPEAQSSQTGVSSEYVQQEGYNWFVLRATYNRVNAAVEKAKKNDIKTYVPMQNVVLKIGCRCVSMRYSPFGLPLQTAAQQISNKNAESQLCSLAVFAVNGTQN